MNNSVKVLMYWNAAIHFGTYECEVLRAQHQTAVVFRCRNKI